MLTAVLTLGREKTEASTETTTAGDVDRGAADHAPAGALRR